MAYFKSNEPYQEDSYQGEDQDESYDDGFDEMNDSEDEPSYSEEEKAERKQNRMRIAFGAGNLFGIVSGAILILVLLTLIFSIIHFMVNDIGRNFSLFQTNF